MIVYGYRLEKIDFDNNTDNPSMQTLSMAPSVSVFMAGLTVTST